MRMCTAVRLIIQVIMRYRPRDERGATKINTRFLSCFCFVFVLSMELCRCSSDIFLSSRPRTTTINTTGLATTYTVLLGMVETRSVNVKNTHTHTHTNSINGKSYFLLIGQGGRDRNLLQFSKLPIIAFSLE